MYLSTQADNCRRDSGVSDMESSLAKSETNGKNMESSLAKSETNGKMPQPVKGKLEYAKLWEELRHTGQGLDDFFEESKESAFEIKRAYDSIHQLMTIKEGLQLKYYEALATKKKFNEERDDYFKTDADLARERDEFIEDSQKHALQHSRYVEYSKRFSKRREEYIERLLRDVEKYQEQVEVLSREKQHLRKEVSVQRQEIYLLKNDLKTKTVQHETSVQTCDKLKKDFEKHKKELQWMNRQVEKLKATNQEIDEANKNMKNRELELQDELKKYIRTIDELSEKRRQLVDRCSQLNQSLQAREKDLEREQDAREDNTRRHEEENNALEKSIKTLENQKRKLKENNQKTMDQLGQLRKRFDTSNKKGALVGKEKNRSVIKEQKTSEKNIELAEKHLELIDEILGLKKTFFEDQERIRKGGRQHRRLEGKMNVLKQQVELLKEDPSVLDPLEFSQEYRDLVVKRIVSAPIQIAPRHGSTYVDTALRRHIPVIGQIPDDKKWPQSDGATHSTKTNQTRPSKRKSASHLRLKDGEVR